tara:strand:- start:393 stop:536 length:144 start_codon:yes stop_codon:yes gene_type:complete
MENKSSKIFAKKTEYLKINKDPRLAINEKLRINFLNLGLLTIIIPEK